MTMALVAAKAPILVQPPGKQEPPPAFVVPEFDESSDGYYQGCLLLTVAEQFKNQDELNKRLRNALTTFREVARKFPNWKKELVAARIKDFEARLRKIRIPEADEPNLQCPHCGERIIARSFGKCPGCYRDLPEDLQLSPREKEMEELEETWRRRGGRRMKLIGSGTGDGKA